MQWINVLSQSELPADARKVVEVEGRKVLLVNHQGNIYAMDNACPHLKLPLKGGKIQDGAIICPFHRSAFDLKSGQVMNWSPFPPVVGPLLGALSSAKAMEVFQIKVEQGNILVSL